MNGPRVVARGKTLAVAWHTEAGGKPRVQFARSTDGGESFEESIVIDDVDPLGRADVASFGEGRHAVCWLGRIDSKRAQVRVRLVAADGAPGPPANVAQVPAARASGFPRMAAHGESILIAWTDPTAGYRVRTARASE